MASISSLMGTSSTSSSSSLYGNNNVISGLASGLDTETLIKNSISGYKTKITTIQQEQQTITWKQDAYRSLIDKMVNITQKYSSYTSKTNLYSNSFFNNAVITATTGVNAALVSATGKTTSDIQINAIKQLATAAKYSVGTEGLNLNTVTSGGRTVTTAGSAIDWSQEISVSNMSGEMTINYGTKSIALDFGEMEIFANATELADAIKEKLSEQDVTLTSGSVKANTLVDVAVDADGTITFSDKKGAGNEVYIKSLSGDIATSTGLEIASGQGQTSFKVKGGDTPLFAGKELAGYMSGKTMTFELDGVKKSIAIPVLPTGTGITDEEKMTALKDGLNSALTSAFGSGKVVVGSSGGALTFDVSQGSQLSVTSGISEAMGLGKDGTKNYLDVSRTLKDIIPSFGDTTQDLVINGVKVGSYNGDTSLETVLQSINSNTELGLTVNYSRTTGKFVFSADETGVSGRIDIGDGDPATDDLATKLFGGGTSQAGTDAVFTATVNGSTMELTRSNNVVDMDGLSVSLKGTFGYNGSAVDPNAEAIGFTTKSDSDTIISAVKSFVEDYNSLVSELRTTYGTQPAIKSDGSRYKPLTEDDKEDMSESAIEKYEAKAKQGALFADSDLSALYSKLRSTISPTGANGSLFNSIGISTKYQDGLTTLSLDENKMRDALATNPDKVRDAFTQSKDGGAATNGLMVSLKSTLETYSSTSLASTGILVKRAGTSLSAVSLLNNTLQSQIDDMDDEVDKLQDKMSNKVDYYTKKFTALEQLISNMNSQSSMLSSMMGG